MSFVEIKNFCRRMKKCGQTDERERKTMLWLGKKREKEKNGVQIKW